MDKVSDDPKRRLKIQSSKKPDSHQRNPVCFIPNLEIYSHAYSDGTAQCGW